MSRTTGEERAHIEVVEALVQFSDDFYGFAPETDDPRVYQTLTEAFESLVIEIKHQWEREGLVDPADYAG